MKAVQHFSDNSLRRHQRSPLGSTSAFRRYNRRALSDWRLSIARFTLMKMVTMLYRAPHANRAADFMYLQGVDADCIHKRRRDSLAGVRRLYVKSKYSSRESSHRLHW